MEPFSNKAVEEVFLAYPEPVKSRLLHLRHLILATAAALKEVGEIEETLKWGQPSYLTAETKSGTTIRIDQLKSEPDCYGMFVHCQTSLLETYRELYQETLSYDGTRCVKFSVDQELPEDAVRHCIRLALTYHVSKRRDRLPF